MTRLSIWYHSYYAAIACDGTRKCQVNSHKDWTILWVIHTWTQNFNSCRKDILRIHSLFMVPPLTCLSHKPRSQVLTDQLCSWLPLMPNAGVRAAVLRWEWPEVLTVPSRPVWLFRGLMLMTKNCFEVSSPVLPHMNFLSELTARECWYVDVYKIHRLDLASSLHSGIFLLLEIAYRWVLGEGPTLVGPWDKDFRTCLSGLWQQNRRSWRRFVWSVLRMAWQ